MNMSPAAALFLLQCILLMDSSEADPFIDVSPSEITLGTTATLDINCTFSLDNHPDMAAFISLVLSRANATGQDYEELAAITQFSPDSVTTITQEKVTATGLHSQTDESFLHLIWQYPTARQGGVYKCSAIGVGMIGHNMEMTNISLVNVDEANLNDILEILQKIEMHESSMEEQIQTLENDKQSMEHNIQTMEQNIQTLQNDKQSMEQNIHTLQSDKQSMEQNIQNMEQNIHTLQNNKQSMEQNIHALQNDKQSMEQNIQTLQSDKISMEKQIAALQSNNLYLEGALALLGSLHVDHLGNHNTKDYYISSNAFRDVTQSIGFCKALGGQLAVIGDNGEFNAIKAFLGTTSGIDFVVIAGTDEQKEGTWVLPETGTPMPFKSWGSTYPRSNNRAFNCVMLYSSVSWSMIDQHCTMDPTQDRIRFLCETSAL